MDTNQYMLETFGCEACGYHQNQDPFVPGVMSQMFPEFPGIQDGACPACYSGRNPQRTKLPSKLSRLVDTSRLSVSTIASDVQLESTLVPELDSQGNPVMVKTGTRFIFNTQTGQPQEVEVVEPKMRPLASQELVALKTQRDKSGESVVRRSVKKL